MAADPLAELNERVRRDLELLNFPAPDWVPPRQSELRPDGAPVLDVVVIGAGMSGLSVAAYLKLRGVSRVATFDRNPAGFEGPWETFARMNTLRTPKHAMGPALSIPSLTPRAWFEARFGGKAWEEMSYINRQDWMAYLRWFREALGIQVTNEAEIVDIEPLQSGRMVVTVKQSHQTQDVETRRLVIATGYGGSGSPRMPHIAAKLPRYLYAHSADEIDLASLAGKRIGVVGAGASSLDNASAALENGAKSVDIFVRRKQVPDTQHVRTLTHIGAMEGFGSLPLAEKLRFWDFLDTHQNPPPRHSLLRMNSAGSYVVHLDSPILDVTSDGHALDVHTKHGRHPVDLMIFGTGFDIDQGCRPELQRLLPHIALLGDLEGIDTRLARKYRLQPLIESDYKFRPRVPGAVPALDNIYCVTDAALVSHLSGVVSCGGISPMATQVGRSIMSSLFAEDAAQHYQRMESYREKEFDESEWRVASR